MTFTITPQASMPPDCIEAEKILLSVPQACSRAAGYALRVHANDTVMVLEAAGRTLAEPIVAKLAMPPFTQSAMDGYALVAGEGIAPGARLDVVDRIAAGSVGRRLVQGVASRLFTGAPLPDGADAVIMQEQVEREGSAIILRPRLVAHPRPRHGESSRGPALTTAAGLSDDEPLSVRSASRAGRIRPGAVGGRWRRRDPRTRWFGPIEAARPSRWPGRDRRGERRRPAGRHSPFPSLPRRLRRLIQNPSGASRI